MLGLPIVPCHQFPEDAKSICLSVQSADDPDIVERVIAFVENGGTAMFTPGFLQKFAFDERILRLSGYANPPVTTADVWTFRFSVNQSSADAEAHIHFVSKPSSHYSRNFGNRHPSQRKYTCTDPK